MVSMMVDAKVVSTNNLL